MEPIVVPKHNMVLSPEDALDAIWDNHPAFTKVSDNIMGKRRWVEEHVAILKHEPSGRFYRVYYEDGLTECQDMRPFDGEYEVLLTHVIPHEVVTISYRTATE